MERTHQVVWYSFYNYGKLEWHQTLTDLEKAPDVAYEDILQELNNGWCVKDVIVICNNLVVTWKVRPHMGIIS